MAKEQFAVAEMVLNMVLGKTGGSRRLFSAETRLSF